MGGIAPVGRYAEILPWDFDELPTTDFAEHALPLFVPMDQATGVALPEVADLTAPAGQQRAFFRLSHLLFRLGDATLDLPWRGHDADDKLPLCAVVGLSDPAMTLWGCNGRGGRVGSGPEHRPAAVRSPLGNVTQGTRRTAGDPVALHPLAAPVVFPVALLDPGL